MKKIKASQIVAGMTISIRYKDHSEQVLVTHVRKSCDCQVEYVHLDREHDMGEMVGYLEPDAKVHLVRGKARARFLSQLQRHHRQRLHSVQEDLDKINLVVSCRNNRHNME